MKFINNSIIPVTSIGNGTTVQAELHTNGSFVKNLGASVATTANSAFTDNVNTETSSGSDFIPVGTNHEIKLSDGIFPSVPSLVPDFEIVDAHVADYPTIPWFNGGSAFLAGNFYYNDAAGTIPAMLHETNATLGTIGNWGPVVINSAPTNPIVLAATQSTVAQQPRLLIDGDGYLFLRSADSGGGLRVVPAANISNDSIMECTFTFSTNPIGGGNAVSNILESILRVRVASTNTLAEIQLFGVNTGILINANTKHVVTALLSSGPAFGDSKVFLDGVESYSVATYFSQASTSGYNLCDSISSNRHEISLYSATIFREGALTPTQFDAVQQWHKDSAGIV